MMRVTIAVLPLLLLCACAPMAATYQVDVIDVQGEWGQLVLNKDDGFCRSHALAHKTPFSPGAIATAAGEGVAANATTAASAPAVAPLVLGVGAAGNASQEMLAEFGVRDPSQVRILVNCLGIRGKKSGAYSVDDSNLGDVP